VNLKAIKLLIVDDSKSTARLLRSLFSAFNVVGVAANGQEALDLNSKLRPDVITMDLHLPDMDGLELTRQILANRRVSIIVISSLLSGKRQNLVFEALRAGAYDAVPKSNLVSDNSEQSSNRFTKLITAAAKRQFSLRKNNLIKPSVLRIREKASSKKVRKIVAIGASTGGPAALRTIFSSLTGGFGLPIVVAQHMAESFVRGFVGWLNTQTRLEVRIAQAGQILNPAVVYFPPAGHHISISPASRIVLEPHHGDNELCPAIDLLFYSVAKVYREKAICLLLTGMGADGAQGLLTAKRCSCLTAVQDEPSSVIFGMPQQALKLGATRRVLPLGQIAEWLKLQADRVG
jgi:two-component system chemotaxis response regulator CheB